MKILPEVNVDPGELFGMVFASLRAKLLLTGIELKVFNQLSEPRSTDAVAQAIGTNPKITGAFLDGLTAIDLLQKSDGLYRNSPITQVYLVEGCQTYLGAALQLLHSQASVENLSKIIKEGPPPTQEMAFSEEMFAEEYASIERTCNAQMIDIVSKLPEFPSFRKMLDLGGGPGLNGMAIAAAHPNMKGVIFDLPPMAKMAEKFIREYGMEDRMGVISGDGFRDPIGEDYDLILACSSLQSFTDKLDYIVKKVYDALNPSGVFISYFVGLTHERTKPEISVLSSLSMALAGYDVGFYQGFVVDAMLRAGFKSVRSRTLNTPMGPMDLDIARK